MADKKVRACFDLILPAELNKVARRKAIAENPANASPFEAAAVKSKLWKPGRTLSVHFLDGLEEVQKEVERYAREWERYANIRFDFVNNPDAEIRISFNEEGSWSAIGTDALVEEFFAKGTPTMNYGWLEPGLPASDYSSVVLHEFGHALGMIHEHQNPANHIRWNKPEVYRSLSGPPNNWDQETIDHNMFERYGATQTQFTAFDDKSIMLYSFPSEWTLDGQSFPVNDQLSDRDKEFITARYPKN